MTRISAATSSMPDLEDHEPYEVSLKSIEWTTSAIEYGGDKRLQLTWAFPNDPDETLRDWMAPKLGKNQSGQVSKLRGLLNALVGKPEATEIAWFDDETLEWSYEGDQPYSKLSVGLPVIIRGKSEIKTGEGGGRRFRITAYQPIKKTASAKPKPAPVAANVDADDVPF